MRQLAALVPNVVRHAEPSEVVHQACTAEVDDVGLAQAIGTARLGGQVGDGPGVSHQEGRLEVGEVGDGLEDTIKRVVGDYRLQRRFGGQHGLPAGGGVEFAEQQRRLFTEDV